jgi:hypothetical protein
MKTVYKYPLEVNVCTIDLPIDSKVVCVHEQNSVPTLWIEHDTTKPSKEFSFCVVATGGHIPNDWEHIGTCFIGNYVWHVYHTNPNPQT